MYPTVLSGSQVELDQHEWDRENAKSMKKLLQSLTAHQRLIPPIAHTQPSILTEDQPSLWALNVAPQDMISSTDSDDSSLSNSQTEPPSLWEHELPDHNLNLHPVVMSWIDLFAERGCRTHLSNQGGPAVPENDSFENSNGKASEMLAEKRLVELVNAGEPTLAIKYYRDACFVAGEDKTSLFTDETIMRLYRLVVRRGRPVPALALFKDYSENFPHLFSQNKVFMLKGICKTLGRLKYSVKKPQLRAKIVSDIIRLILQLDVADQTIVVPELLINCVQVPELVNLTQRLYQHTQKHKMEFPTSVLQELLRTSSFDWEERIPLGEIAHQLHSVRGEKLGVSPTFLLEHKYPFLTPSFKDVKIYLRIILETGEPVDMAVLEAIGAAAANAGDVELSTLTWEIVESRGFVVPQAFHENMIISMASNPDMYDGVFFLMNQMESHGFELTRALIRSISFKIRNNRWQVFRATDILEERKIKGEPINLASLNLVMTAWAERGDDKQCRALLNQFEDFGLKPCIYSYGCIIESLGKAMACRTYSRNQLEARCVRTADEIMGELERWNIAPDRNFVRQYVELLLQFDQVETANEVLDSMLGTKGLVDNRTLYRVATANIKTGNLVKARWYSVRGTESMPFLQSKIDSMLSARKRAAGCGDAQRQEQE